jgi:hypothetical protein
VHCLTLAVVGHSAVPTGAGYSVLLLLHVAAAVVGFGALAVTGAQAGRARRGPGQPGAEGVRRYFRPGVNWAGRVLYVVPVAGFGLVADSNGAFAAAQGFVVSGLVLWVLATAVAEAVVWPGERRLQQLVTEAWDEPIAMAAIDSEAQRVQVAAVVTTVVFVVAVVLMFGKP